MIQKGHAQVLAIDSAVVIDPTSDLGPSIDIAITNAVDDVSLAFGFRSVV